MRSSCLDYSHPNKRMDHVIQLWDGYSSYLLIINETSCDIFGFFSPTLRILVLTSLTSSSWNLDTKMVEPFKLIRAVNWLACQFCKTTPIFLNLTVLIVPPPRTWSRKSTTTNWPFRLTLFSMVLDYSLSTGHLLFFMLSTCTIVLFIPSQSAPHSNAFMVQDQI